MRCRRIDEPKRFVPTLDFSPAGAGDDFCTVFHRCHKPVAAQQTSCAFADVNGDGVVDDADLLQVLFCFGTSTPLTIPDIDEMVAMRLTAAFPTHFPGAPDVPFNPQDAAFARTRISSG
jgi:hypothetical protein